VLHHFLAAVLVDDRQAIGRARIGRGVPFDYHEGARGSAISIAYGLHERHLAHFAHVVVLLISAIPHNLLQWELLEFHLWATAATACEDKVANLEVDAQAFTKESVTVCSSTGQNSN